MRTFDIKPIVKDALREAFYTKKPTLTEGHFSLIVGNIEQDGHIQAQDTSTTGETHGQLFGGYEEGSEDWRYSELTKMVYWKYDHPKKFEELVEEWLNNEGFLVRNHIVLDNIKDPILFKKYWHDAHGKGIRFDELCLSKESINMLTESLGEYLTDVNEELSLWLETTDKQLLIESVNNRLKVKYKGKEYPALISLNTKHEHNREGAYRLTWINPENHGEMYHIPLNADGLNCILAHGELPNYLKLAFTHSNIEPPELIF